MLRHMKLPSKHNVAIRNLESRSYSFISAIVPNKWLLAFLLVLGIFLRMISDGRSGFSVIC